MGRILVVMGVSGSGKSTIGSFLSEKTAIPFFDADDFHPPANVEKMSDGLPLSDDDRKPWLEVLASKIKVWAESESGAILACSALKKAYRDILSGNGQVAIDWIFLEGSFNLLAERMAKRESHFMPSELLKSQFDTLEIPSEALRVDVAKEPEAIINEIVDKLGLD